MISKEEKFDKQHKFLKQRKFLKMKTLKIHTIVAQYLPDNPWEC